MEQKTEPKILEPGMLNSYKITLENYPLKHTRIIVEENGKQRGIIVIRDGYALIDFGGDKFQVPSLERRGKITLRQGYCVMPDGDGTVLAWHENYPERKEITLQRAWEIIDRLAWGTKSTDKIKLGQFLKKEFPGEIDALKDFVKVKRLALVKRLNEYADKVDNGFADGHIMPLEMWDLTAHIVGLGAEKYNEVMDNPEIAKAMAKAKDYKENFQYIFSYTKDEKPMKKQIEWSHGYDELKPGHIFEMEGLPGQYEVVDVTYTPGGGQGMGEHPPNWKIHLKDGFYFDYDPWCNHIYRRMRIVKFKRPPMGPPPKSFTAHYTQKYLAEKEADRKRREEAKIPAIIKRLDEFRIEMSNRGLPKPSFYLSMNQMGQLNDVIKSWEEAGIIKTTNDVDTLGYEKIDGFVALYNDIILVYNPVKGYTDNNV